MQLPIPIKYCKHLILIFAFSLFVEVQQNLTTASSKGLLYLVTYVFILSQIEAYKNASALNISLGRRIKYFSWQLMNIIFTNTSSENVTHGPKLSPASSLLTKQKSRNQNNNFWIKKLLNFIFKNSEKCKQNINKKPDTAILTL